MATASARPIGPESIASARSASVPASPSTAERTSSRSADATGSWAGGISAPASTTGTPAASRAAKSASAIRGSERVTTAISA